MIERRNIYTGQIYNILLSNLIEQFVLLSLPKLFYFNFICFSMSFPICLDVYLSVSLEIQLLEHTQCAFSLCV